MALSSDDIDDIKQLFVANNQVLRAEMDERMDAKLGEKLAPIKQQLDCLATVVTDVLDTNNKRIDGQLTDHERRITHLERAA